MSAPYPTPDVRTSPVRFTLPVGLVTYDDPGRFVERICAKGDLGRLIVEGEPPFATPEGWVVVIVDDDEHGRLYAPVHPGMVEAVER